MITPLCLVTVSAVSVSVSKVWYIQLYEQGDSLFSGVVNFHTCTRRRSNTGSRCFSIRVSAAPTSQRPLFRFRRVRLQVWRTRRRTVRREGERQNRPT